MSKQDQIDQLGRRVGELEATVNGDDLGRDGLVAHAGASHDQLASLRRRVKDLENMTGKQAKEPEPVTSVELAVWKERAEKAEAALADAGYEEVVTYSGERRWIPGPDAIKGKP